MDGWMDGCFGVFSRINGSAFSPPVQFIIIVFAFYSVTSHTCGASTCVGHLHNLNVTVPTCVLCPITEMLPNFLECSVFSLGSVSMCVSKSRSPSRFRSVKNRRLFENSRGGNNVKWLREEETNSSCV